MKRKINETIERISKIPLERFGTPILLSCGCVCLLSALLIIRYLHLPVAMKIEDQVIHHSLGTLLWKARTNR